MLDFSPTDSGSGKELLKSASTAITSVNGVYRSMWTAGWSTTANTHQCFGIAAYNLALDCMADDLIMQSQGNGWFWGDHCYNIKSNYTFVGSSVPTTYGMPITGGYPMSTTSSMQPRRWRAARPMWLMSWDRPTPSGPFCYLNLATWFSRAPYNPMTGNVALERALRTGLHHGHVDRHGRTAPRIAAHGLRPYRPGHRPCHRTARKGQGNHAGRE